MAAKRWAPIETGLQAVHQRPLVTNTKKADQGRRSVQEAWAEWHRLQINPPHAYAALLFDVDNPTETLDGRPKPLPSWIVTNLQNGHLHVGYALENPVGRHDKARLPPQRYAAHVADRLSLYLNADPGYTALLHRNPMNPGPDCEVWQPELWLRTHSLEDIDKAIPKHIQPVEVHQTGMGRNVDLFHTMLKEIHRPRWAETLKANGWRDAWLDYVRGQNVVMFPGAELPDIECRAIAKSCYRYWGKQYSPARFASLQSQRQGKRWHGDFAFDFEARDASIIALKNFGFTQREIGEMVDLKQARISKVLKKYSYHNSYTLPEAVIPNPSRKGDSEPLSYLPTTSWGVVTTCTLCAPEKLHRPGPVLCLRCGTLSLDAQERHRLPMK